MPSKWQFLLCLLTVIFLFKASPVKAVAPDNYRWHSSNTGLAGSTIVGLAVDPTNTSIVYALTSSKGVYKSTDAGTNWSAKNSGLPSDLAVLSWGDNSLTMDPNNHLVLYINIDGVVYKTTNGGDAWSSANSGITFSCGTPAIAGVAVDPTDSNHLYAGSIISGCSGGVFESTNAGTSWTQIAGHYWGGGTVGGYGDNDGWPLAIDPSDTTKVYISSIYINSESYRSLDGGTNWTKMTVPGSSLSGNAAVVHPTSHKLFIGTEQALLVSTDYGVTLTADANFAGQNISGIAFAPSDATVGYLTTQAGKIYKSTDSGDTWTLQSTNSSIQWNLVKIDPLDATKIYLGTNGAGVYKSTNSGTAVTQINTGLPISFGVLWLANSETVLLANRANASLVRSTDNGRTWQEVLGYNSWQVSFAKSNPNIVYGTFATSPYTIKKSIDAGLTWSTVYSTSTFSLIALYFGIDPNDANTVVAWLYGGTLIKTTDGGTTWSAPYAVPAFASVGANMEGMASDLVSSQNYYARGVGDFFKSTDSGATWAASSTGLECSYCDYVDELAIDPNTPTTMFAGVRAGKIFKSTNSGGSWTAVYDYGNTDVFRLSVDPSNSNNIFAGSGGWVNDFAVYSTDGGTTWNSHSMTGFSATDYFNDVIRDPDDSSRIIAGSNYNGVQVYENYIPKFHTSTFTVANTNGKTTYKKGDILDFTFTLTNSGPAAGTSPSVKFVLPSGLIYVTNSTTRDSAAVLPDPYTANTRTLQVPTADIAYNTSVSLTFQATIDMTASGELAVDNLVTSDEDTLGTEITDVVFSVAPDTITTVPSSTRDPNIKEGWEHPIFSGWLCGNYLASKACIFLPREATSIDLFPVISIGAPKVLPRSQGLNISGEIYSLQTVSSFNGYSLNSLAKPVIISLPYFKTNPRGLKIGWFNGKRWQLLTSPLITNYADKTISTTTKELGYFALVKSGGGNRNPTDEQYFKILKRDNNFAKNQTAVGSQTCR